MDEAEEIARQLGGRIRQARQAKGMTLDALSEAAGLSTAFLSRLERGAVSTSIANLIRISGALGVPLQEIFDEGEAAAPQPKRYALVKRTGQRPAPVVSAAGYRYVRLGGDLAGQRLDAFELEFPVGAGERILLVAHEGEEVLYLLAGRIEFQIGADRFVMEAGDCVHFDCEQPHMGRNIGDEPARMLMVVSRPGARLTWWNAPLIAAAPPPAPPKRARPAAATASPDAVPKSRRGPSKGGRRR